jgi:hypothetical protein
MSMYDDGTTQTMGGPPPGMPMHQQQPMQMPPPPYGYGYGGYGMRMRRNYPIETKPFFLTSEFAVSLLAVIAIAITAASSHAFGAWRAWILITGIVAAYNVSRGIAKAGIKSTASDPRENLDLNWGRGDHHGDGHQG